MTLAPPADRPDWAASDESSPAAADRASDRATQITAIHDYLANHVPGIGEIETAVFLIRTHQQAERLATMLAGQCPDPLRAAAGIWELLANAIEHGNLAISCDDKTALLKSGQFAAEIGRRAAADPYAARRVRVEFHRRSTASVVTITDEGDGFDYRYYLECEPTYERPNGRGLYVASRYAFDELTFLGKGNCVRAVMQGAADD